MFLLNGVQADSLSLQDRGLQYGDGLFETIAVRSQQFEFWQRHMQRLLDGCLRLRISAPDPELFLAEARRLLDGRTEAVLKIIITRGQGGRGYRAPLESEAKPSRILAVYDMPDYPAENQSNGIAARYCGTRLGTSPALAGIKHLNRLEQVLARSEWQDETIFEGLMLAAHGRVTAGTMSNLFFVKAGILCSPDLSNAGVAGIMREVILAIAHKQKIEVEIAHFSKADLKAADEVFISNSLIGVWPIRQLEQQQFSIGPVTQKIIAAVNAARLKDTAHEAV